jgi:CBS domain-containing protein
MDNQSATLEYPALDLERWTTTGKEPAIEKSAHLDFDDFCADLAPGFAPVAAGAAANGSAPVSSVMEETLWMVHAEDAIEKVEELLAAQGLVSVPVLGSNGEIVGMIGTPELALFHAENKNAKAVRAWEISRCKTFEVSPDDTIEEVAKLMSDNKIEHIAVTTGGDLQGVVSVHDLIEVILRENAAEAIRA